MYQNRNLSRQLLTRTAELLEEADRQRGRFNDLAGRFAARACHLLGFEDLVLRLTTLLSSAAHDVPYPWTLPAISDIEREHPWFTDDYATVMLSTVGQSEAHLQSCLERDYETAFAHAESELAKEEVALTLAILGDTELALESVARLSEQHRQDNVLFVVTLELYRHGKTEAARTLHQRLSENTLNEWDLTHLALGVAHRIPWIGYPYPDY